MSDEYTFSGYQVSTATAKILADADRAARKEDERREGEIEAARYRALMFAPAQREAYELARRSVDLAAERQERAEERERQERAEQAANHQAALIMSGQRPHTVQDVLDAARAWV
jgi:hypothetical protein